MAHFLIPMGTKTKALPEQEGALDTKQIRFAKDRRPKLREGHMLILFAAGSEKLVTYLSATSNVQHDPDNEQYPWFVNTKDWAPDYSKRWWTFGNVLGTLATEHLAANPANKLAAVKPMDAASFATSIYGKSSLELHTDFAYSLINRMKAR